MKKILVVIFGLLIGAVSLYLTLRQIDLTTCFSYIVNAKWQFILLSALVYSFAFMVRAVRWHYLLSPLKLVPAKRLFFLIQIGFFMNNLLPLRLGEIIRAHISGKKIGVSRSGVLATVVVERLFDGLSYVILFLMVIPFLPVPQWAKKSLLMASLVFILGPVILFLMMRHRESAIKLFSKLPFPQIVYTRINTILTNFIEGLAIFNGKKDKLYKVIILSLCVWIIEGSVFYVLSFAYNIPLTFFQGLFVMIIIGTGSMLPTAPGFVGTVEFLGVTSLAFIGINKNLAFGYIITLHAMQLLTIFFWGITAIFKEKLTFSELIHPK